MLECYNGLFIVSYAVSHCMQKKMFVNFIRKYLLTDCGTSPTILNSRKNVKKTIVLSDVMLESEVQYTCDINYKSNPSTATRTYTCENGGSFTHTEFECLRGKVLKNKLKLYAYLILKSLYSKFISPRTD